MAEQQEQRRPVRKSEDPYTRANSQLGQRPSGARRNSGHVTGQQVQRLLVRKTEDPNTSAKTSARSSSIGGAAKPRNRGLAIRTAMAHTEVRGSIHGVETLNSIGPHRGRGETAATRPGNKTNDSSYGSQRTRTRGRNLQLDRRLSGGAAKQRQRGRVTKQAMARTKVKGPIDEGDNLCSFSAHRGRGEAAVTWLGTKNSGGSYGSQRTST